MSEWRALLTTRVQGYPLWAVFLRRLLAAVTAVLLVRWLWP